MRRSFGRAGYTLALMALFFLKDSPRLGAQEASYYQIFVDKVLSVTGDIKRETCDDKCFEGHDCTTCIGVRIFTTGGVALQTTVYDKIECCHHCGGVDHRWGLCGIHDCPKNHCPANDGPFTAPLQLAWRGCAAAGETFHVPPLLARIGNLHNNQPTCGAKCAGDDFYQPFADQNRQDELWGNFSDTCPNPSHPEVRCIPTSFACDGSPAPTPGPTPTPTPPAGGEGSCGYLWWYAFYKEEECTRDHGVCHKRLFCGDNRCPNGFCFEPKPELVGEGSCGYLWWYAADQGDRCQQDHGFCEKRNQCGDSPCPNGYCWEPKPEAGGTAAAGRAPVRPSGRPSAQSGGTSTAAGVLGGPCRWQEKCDQAGCRSERTCE